jgi:uncharacterized protein
MKLHLDARTGANAITGYGDGYVLVNGNRHEQSLVLTPTGVPARWGESGFAALAEADFAHLAGLGAEIVLLGTGMRQQFPPPRLLRPLIEARIGFEVMDLHAACRTYNILLGEGRRVAAALLFD